MMSTLLALALLQPLPDEGVVMRFDPPLDTPIVESYVQTSVQQLPGETRERVNRSRSIVRFSKIENGWARTAAVEEATATINGTAVDSPLVSEMVGLELRGILDEDSRLVAVEGYEEFLERLAAHLPAEALAQIRSVAGPEAALARQRTEWDGRVADFVGVEVAPDDVFTYESEFPLPGGESLVYDTTITIEGWEPCGTAHCLRIVTRYSTDEAEMGETIGQLVPGAASPAKVRIEGGGVRLIDPTTMNIHEERIERTMIMLMGEGDEQVPVEQTEVREYHYEYPEPMPE